MEDNKANNTGIDNTGHWNTGNLNSGDRNSGYWNTGNRNTGDLNSGHLNSGDRNSGHRNSGDRNSGYGNSTNRSAGIFNSEEGTVRLFNKESNLKWDEIAHPYFNEFTLTKWIPEDKMTDEEKTANPDFHTTDGYLKTFTYEEAWANYWRDTTEDDRQRVLNLPNFDPKVFRDITGIDVEAKKTVTIDGKEYELTDELAEVVKKIKERSEFR